MFGFFLDSLSPRTHLFWMNLSADPPPKILSHVLGHFVIGIVFVIGHGNAQPLQQLLRRAAEMNTQFTIRHAVRNKGVELTKAD